MSNPTKAQSKILSVIIPCYNEEAVISETVKRLKAFTAGLKNLEAEFIFVDDGSFDQTRSILKSHAYADERIKVIGFSRNFGQQMALTAGIDAAQGDAIVLIDADLQNPPEFIHEMIKKWEEGYDVVYGIRSVRPGESFFKLFTSRLFYRILNKFSSVFIPDTGDFRLMTRPVVDVLKSMPEQERFIRGMVSWVGFKQIALPYNVAERFAGETKWSVSKLVVLARDAILSFSNKPLEFILALGLGITTLTMLGLILVIIQKLITGLWLSKMLILLLVVGFLGGIQLLSIGVLGQYIGRIYTQIKNRPRYVVQEFHGFKEAQQVEKDAQR
jgi:glycosyltransferase involved in cell wall biosynthesis